MAEAILGALLQQLMDNVNSLIQKEVHLFFGVKNDAEKLFRTLSTVLDVLEDAESRKIRDKSLANWLKNLKDAAYDATDALDEWALEAQQLDEAALTDRGWTSQVSDSLMSCLNLKHITFRRKMGKRFKDIINKFDEIAAERSKFHLRPVVVETGSQFDASRETSFTPTEPKIYGRDDDKNALINILLGNVSRDENVSICSIFGIGGLGKTTLARSVYNDERVQSYFDDKIWVCVSDPFDVKKVLKAIVEYSFKESARDLETLQSIQSKVGELLRGKKYLLVLDNVWNDKQEEWNRLKSSLMEGAKGSSIIVTTRLDKVASITGTMPKYVLKPLSDDDCWTLFKSRAFGGKGEENLVLVEIGKDIVKKCKGVPLAAKSLGSLLSFKLDESYWKLVRNSEMWNLEENAESGILPALRLSYRHLSPQLKRCFAYCAIFPRDHVMYKDELVRLWIANDFIPSDGGMELEDIGNVIFDELLWRSFFQDYDIYRRCKMHDLMHDLASSVMEDDISTKQVRKTRHFFVFCASSPSTDLDSFLKTQTSLRSLTFFSSINASMINFSTNASMINFSINASMINFSNLRCLRVLSLKGMEIETLPSSICDLKLLRYLDLSYNRITSLPESIHGLRSLQMLDLSWNMSLETLPFSIGKLESLRYLNLDHCRTITLLPETVGDLRNLRSLMCWSLQVLPETMRNMKKLRHLNLVGCGILKKMPVGIGELRCLETLSHFVVGRCNDSGSISELKNLNNLRGRLQISGLENVRNVEEVKEAKLRDKQYLTELELRWGRSCDSNVEVLEALSPPPPCLESLVIIDYQGVYLQQFLECTCIKKLCIHTYHSNTDVLEALTLLPPCIEEVTIDKYGGAYLQQFLECCLSTSCLKKLFIYSCKGIKCLPKVIIGIQQQHLNNNISSSFSSLVELVIWSCENLTSVSEGLRHQTSLQSLYIARCPELELGVDDFQHLVSLRSLTLWNLPKVTSLPESVQHLTMLQKLQIWGFEKLRRLPEGLKHLTALQFLNIYKCHPELHTRCEKEKGLDWHIISHIRRIVN